MAQVTKGQTFASNETITNTKLHNLVDLATVTDIALADFVTGVRPATVATGAPSSPTKGDIWVDTSLTDPQIRAARADGTFVNLHSIPTGGIIFWPTVSSPEGWLLCDGSAISRTTYAALFAVHGTTFGVGDGSTTFNVPDIRGRVPLGTGTGSGLTARTLAATGGVESASFNPNGAYTLGAGAFINVSTLAESWILADAGGQLRASTSGGTSNPLTKTVVGSFDKNLMNPFLVLTGIIRT